MHRLLPLMLCLFVALTTIACKKADLVPVPGPQGFCKVADGKLVVTVKNQGEGNAAASATQVDFGTPNPSTIPTPAIPAGSSVDLPGIAIPGACYHPDCSFTIKVDSGSTVPETNETNNTGSGTCIG